jgi:type II secretion system protein N
MKLQELLQKLPPLNERTKKWGRRVGYVAFYVFMLVVFVSLLFPYMTLRDSLVAQFNAQQKAAGSPQQLSIDDMGWYWFSGVRAKGIRLTSPSTEAGKPPTVIEIDEAHGRISLLGLLIGNKDVSFHLGALGGDIDGSFELHGKDRAVDLKLDNVDLDKVDALTQMIGLPIEGKISGTIKVALPEGKASKGTGSVDLQGKDVAIGDGKAKLKNALEWPKMTVGDLTFQADAKDGVLKITKFGASGHDLELNGDGKVQMRELATESSLDVNVKFKIADSYKGKSDITKNLFGPPGGGKAGDIELFVPEMKAAKRPDGFYGFHVTNLLGNPKFMPAGSGLPSSIPQLVPGGPGGFGHL